MTTDESADGFILTRLTDCAIMVLS